MLLRPPSTGGVAANLATAEAPFGGVVVKNPGGVASGPVGFTKTVDAATAQIKSGSRRRGANSACSTSVIPTPRPGRIEGTNLTMRGPRATKKDIRDVPVQPSQAPVKKYALAAGVDVNPVSSYESAHSIPIVPEQ